MVPDSAVPLLALLAVLVIVSGVQAHVCDGTCSDIGCNPHGCIVPPKSFAYIGEELVLKCTLRDLLNINSSKLYFTIGNDANMSSDYQAITSPYVLELRVPVGNESMNEVTVTCQAVSLGSWTSRVRVDYRLREVTNFSVVVQDWKNITIGWHMFDYIYTPTVHINWIINNNPRENDTCTDSRLNWCFLDWFEEELYTIILNVSSRNDRVPDSVTSTFTFNARDHVQPGAVSWLLVRSVDSRCVEVEWNHTHSHKNLLYRLSLRSISQTDQKTDRWRTNRTSEQVCGLRADTQYAVSVSAIPARGGFWSVSRTVNFTTSQDYPEKGPVTTKGGFAEEECQNGVRTVHVYLVPPDESSWNGQLTNYALVYVPSGARSNMSYTAEVDSVFHQVLLSCSLQYDVYISVYNNKGGSPSSHLHIPRQDKDGEVRSVVLEKNGTDYQLIFPVQVQPVVLTLFRCRASFNDEYQCREELSWRLLNKSHSPLHIDYNASYIYGISMTTTEHIHGVSWARCMFDLEIVPAPPSVASRPQHGLTVSWREDECLGRALLLSYTLQHCAPGHRHCQETTLASDHSEYVISRLEGGVNYSVRVRQRTVSGKYGPFSQPVFAVSTGLTETELAGLALGLALGAIIVLAFLLGCARRIWMNYHKKEIITLPVTLENWGQHIYNRTVEGNSESLEELSSPLPDRVLTSDESGETDNVSPSQADHVLTNNESTETDNVSPSQADRVLTYNESTETDNVSPSQADRVLTSNGSTETDNVSPSQADRVLTSNGSTETDNVSPSQADRALTSDEGGETDNVSPSQADRALTSDEGGETDNVSPSQADRALTSDEGGETDKPALGGSRPTPEVPVHSDITIDPYVTAATSEENHQDNEYKNMFLSNKMCVASDWTVESYATVGT